MLKFIVAIACALCAQAPPARDFDIPAGLGAETILTWSHQSHIQVLFDFHNVFGVKTARLKGKFEPVEALRRMLKSTDLDVDETVPARAVAVIRKDPYCHPEFGPNAPLPPCIQKPLQVRMHAEK